MAVIVVVAEPGPPLLYIAVLTAILVVGSLLRLRADGRRARTRIRSAVAVDGDDRVARRDGGDSNVG